MANPQLEDGYTQIANEILEGLMKTYLPANQWQVLLCVIRKTYGFKKKVDWIANCQIVEATGLVKSTVSRALRGLEQHGLIARHGKSIGFQKDWEQWKVSRTANSEKLAIPQPELADGKPKLAVLSTKVSSPRDTQKKKETIQKKLYKRKKNSTEKPKGEVKESKEEETTVVVGNPSKEEVLEAYRQNIGELSGGMDKQVELAVDLFSASWVIDAIREALLHNKRTWEYIAGILKNWGKDGKDAGTTPKGLGDPDKFIKGKYGHLMHG